MKQNTARYLGLFVLSLLSLAFSLPGPAISGHIIDKVVASKNFSKVTLLVGILLSLLLANEITRTIKDHVLVRLSQQFAQSVRTKLIERILGYPLSYFRQFQPGYIVARLDEADILGGFFTTTLISGLENFVRLLGALYLITRLNAKLALVSMAVMPLYFEIMRRSFRTIRRINVSVMDQNAELKRKIQETLAGIEVVKTYAKEHCEAAEIEATQVELNRAEVFKNLISSISGRLLSIVLSADMLAILWVGSYEIMLGRLTVGGYIAFVAYIGYMYSPVQMCATMFLHIQGSLVVCKRVASFLIQMTEDETLERTESLKKVRGEIDIDRVSFCYDKGEKALSDISLHIRPGERVAFVGENGSGKSTLISLLLGLFRPTSGCILVDGIDLNKVKLNSLRNRVGIVSQDIFLFNDSILNNIRYGRPNAPLSDIIKAAKMSGCHKFICALPSGYETKAGDLGKKLSGGEKQRISMARCVLKEPDVIILDEPVAHLDPLVAEELMDSIHYGFSGKTCIIISHHLTNLSWVDSLYVMSNGRIIQKGTHNELICTCAEYRKLYRASAGSVI